MDLNDFLEIFLDESKEHLQAINEELLKLETEPENLDIVNVIFRSAHTLKGMSSTMGYEDLASLTHQMENVLDLIRHSKLSIDSTIMDVLFLSVDYIEKMVTNIEQGGDGRENVVEVVSRLTQIQNPSATLSAQEVAVTVVEDYEKNALIEMAKESGKQVYDITVTIEETCMMKSIRAYLVFQTAEELGEVIYTQPPVEQIEEGNFQDTFSLLLLSEQSPLHIEQKILNISEIKAVTVAEANHQQSVETKVTSSNELEPKTAESNKTTVENKPNNVSRSNDTARKKQRTKSIRVDIEKLDQLMNLFSEMVIDRGRLEQIARDTKLFELTETVEHMALVSSDLQEIILKMRMVPVDQVFSRFPRMVRDTAKDLNKIVQLVIEGEDTELDRTVIDEIGDPLVHLLRNALDHGLESTEARVMANKKEEGTISLKAYRSGNHVYIEVADDGGGINRDKVLTKAMERGVVSNDEAQSLTDKQVFELLFSSGFSTADKISDLSGRGVGLDVVKSKIESLGGVITIDSALGQGSTFRIQLPLTLSIINAMLVKTGEETYGLPFSSILEITKVKPNDITTLHGKKVIQFRGQTVPLVFLNEEFGISKEQAQTKFIYIVIVQKRNQLVGIVIDSVVGQQEVVLKSLGQFLTNLYAISGSTILGNGEVALILDTDQFFK